MKFGIMGAGAVGCYYGAKLAKAGHPVRLVGRPLVVERIKQSGLLFETADTCEALSVEASEDPSILRDCDVVLFCVKSTDTESAGRDMAPFIRSDTTVVSFQNGLGNIERLEAVLGRPIVPAVVYVAAEIVEIGHVKHLGRGDIVLGSSVASAEIARKLVAAGVPTRVSPRVITDLWSKLAVNCAYNALSAISHLPYGTLIQTRGVRDVINDVLSECTAVALSEDVELPDGIKSDVFGIAETMAGQYSSTSHDLMRHKPTEIDYINGYVVRKGDEATIPTPVNRALYVMVKLAEVANKAKNGRHHHQL